MSHQSEVRYEFDDFLLDPCRRVLLRNNDPVVLTPKAFDTLLVLVRKGGNVVEKEELLREIWPDTFVEEATLAQNVYTLRKALGQHQDSNLYIETVPRHGYRFAADVHEVIAAREEIVFERRTRTRVLSEQIEGSINDLDQTVLSSIMPEGVRPDSVISKIPSHSQTAILTLTSLVRNKWALILTVALAITLASAVFFSVRFNKHRSGLVAPLKQMRVKRLTNNGMAVCAAISRDGRYVAYVTQERDKQSLWLRQVSANSSVEILSAANRKYRAITFSGDGNSIYYVRFEPDRPHGSLNQIPILGGTANEIAADVDSAIAFSPDMKRIAFFRDYPEVPQTALIIVNADGSGERQLTTHAGFFYGEGPAWSPDGKAIAFPIFSGDPNRSRHALMTIGVEDGLERSVATRQWDLIGQVAWTSDGSRIVFAAWDESTGAFSSQLWELSLHDGQIRRITNDLNSYLGVTLTSDLNALVTIQSDRIANFWTTSSLDLNDTKQLTSGIGDKGSEVLGAAWGPQNVIVYGSTAGGSIDVWALDLENGKQKQLTTDPLPDFKPTVSQLDGSIVFVSKRTGSPHLWIMDSDGANARQLTNGNTESYPNFAPNGKWVAFVSITEGSPTIWRLQLDTGEQIKLTNKIAAFPSVSPDGKLIACFYNESINAPRAIALIPFDGGLPVKFFEIPPTVFIRGGIRWMNGGQAVSYINNERGTSNLWSQPIQGGPPKPLTHFTSDQIYRFDWSPDGKQLLLERGSTLSDVVLITDF
jgi:Tol biopolymer transport system component/DNA-binding winged helix-turn-helix (wHTH) protein